MKPQEFVSTAPIMVQKSVRTDEVRALTTCDPGLVVPIAFIPMLREDRIARCSLDVQVRMAETIQPLANAVNLTVMAHFVPWSALERFEGFDQFNRSYQMVAEKSTGTEVEFIKRIPFDKTSPFWKTLGVHWINGNQINAFPLEAYNTLINWRRESRTDSLSKRDLYNQTSLARAFWKNPNMWYIKPDFDSAITDAQVALSGQAPVSGVGRLDGNATAPGTNINARETDTSQLVPYEFSQAASSMTFRSTTNDAATAWPAIYAELGRGTAGFSLADIELAKQTVAFAKLREQYDGISDDHLVDMLMSGIRVPDEALRQPILLDQKSTVFGYAQRYSTDADALDASVTRGFARVRLNIRTPEMNSGGIVLITCEIVPEALFERKFDRFLGMVYPSQFPNFLRDYLDPEKIDVVQNRFTDVLHSEPLGTFGYAPLNHEWKRSLVHAGGAYYRPDDNSFVEDRQRFWSVEQLDPTLTEDFYLVPANLPKTVFADQEAQPFEILCTGGATIVGNTVFGPALVENKGLFEQVDSEVNKNRIDQAAATSADETQALPAPETVPEKGEKK